MAALQTALSTKGLYSGTIDGVRGPATRSAVRRFQRQVGLQADGVVGRQTRRALGRFGRHKIGSRVLHRGAFGWDVAALQFQLAWHGFASGTFDGAFGQRTENALMAFQEWAGLSACVEDAANNLWFGSGSSGAVRLALVVRLMTDRARAGPGSAAIARAQGWPSRPYASVPQPRRRTASTLQGR